MQIETYRESLHKIDVEPASVKPDFCLVMKAKHRVFGFVRVYQWREYYEPHIDFFQATKREMYEGINALIRVLTKTRPMLIKCRETFAPFYDRWVAHGIGKKIGIEQKSGVNIHVYTVTA